MENHRKKLISKPKKIEKIKLLKNERWKNKTRKFFISKTREV